MSVAQLQSKIASMLDAFQSVINHLELFKIILKLSLKN